VFSKIITDSPKSLRPLLAAYNSTVLGYFYIFSPPCYASADITYGSVSVCVCVRVSAISLCSIERCGRIKLVFAFAVSSDQFSE